MTDSFSRYFSEAGCPICGDQSSVVRYPIDKNYLFTHTKVDVEDCRLGVAQCMKCGHQFIHPRPSHDFLSLFYASYMSAAKNGFYKARQAEYIPDQFSSYYTPWLNEIKSLLKAEPPRLLDVGCGLGMFLRLARDRGFSVGGVEPNSEAVKALMEKYSIHAYNSLLEDYQEDEHFDAVTMWDLLEHLADPAAAVEKASSILNPEGLLTLEIPIRDSLLHWTAKALYRLSFGKVRRPLYLIYGIHHLQYFSQKSIQLFLRGHGYEIVMSRRAETNLDALRKSGVGLKSRLYNYALATLLLVARLVGRQNKLVVIARKSAA